MVDIRLTAKLDCSSEMVEEALNKIIEIITSTPSDVQSKMFESIIPSDAQSTIFELMLHSGCTFRTIRAMLSWVYFPALTGRHLVGLTLVCFSVPCYKEVTLNQLPEFMQPKQNQ